MKVYSILIAFVFLVGCKKPEDRSCWKFAGDTAIKTVPLNDFELLFLDAHLEYVLVQDSVNYLIIEGHENLINLVETEIVDGKLSVKNKNKCNFLRNYKTKNIKVEIHFKSILNMEYQGTETLNSEGTLNLPYFTFTISDGAGPINLNLNSSVVVGILKHGYGDFTLSGTVNYANFIVGSNGYCNTNNLNVLDSIAVVSKSTVPCKYNFSTALAKVEIQNSGDIEYIGYPTSIKKNIYGTGQLIDKN